MMRRAAFAVLAPVAMALLSAAPANARELDAYALTEAAAELAPGRFLWTETSDTGPVSVLISLPDQRAYVFRGQTLFAASTISTGKDGKETPTGSYPILQKKAVHHSNLYDDAPMPFMQRLTWDGVALHAGRNPGFPASHGCVRLPAAFAKKLFSITEVGTTVEVTDEAYIGPPVPLMRVDDLASVATERETASANKRSARRLDRSTATR